LKPLLAKEMRRKKIKERNWNNKNNLGSSGRLAGSFKKLEGSSGKLEGSSGYPKEPSDLK
jgi:hypothetical protein